ncbi:DUF3880 domain-containing protein [Paenibacillus sp. FSL H7-0703]|uniref:CgeB family protein n=1 Tax=Paenibacillus sp. FSL H7-0703 TaxID=2921438 RepID=UPI0030FB41C6
MKDVNDQQSGHEREAYRCGYREGRRMGGCTAALSQVVAIQPAVRHLKVLYIPQGFAAIDTGVQEALGQICSSCAIGTPATMLADAEAQRPDLVLVMNGLHVFPADHLEQVQQIRALGIRTAIWFVDDPYFTEDTALICQSYDVVFTHEISCLPFYRDQGVTRVHYLPLAASARIFYPRRVEREHQHDICFIGNAFWNRVKLFDHLAPFLADKRVLIVGGHWDRLTRRDVLERFIRPGFMEPEETAQYYNGSKIVINMHRPTDPGLDNRNTHQLSAESINPRTYEISACGTLQMTDVRKDLSRYYRPGYDIETFSGAEELKVKLDYYLKHDWERERMAWRALYTTMQKHMYSNRMEELLDKAMA